MSDGRYLTGEEVLQVKNGMLKFILRVLEGKGTSAEVAILPEVLKLLPSYW